MSNSPPPGPKPGVSPRDYIPFIVTPNGIEPLPHGSKPCVLTVILRGNIEEGMGFEPMDPFTDL